MRQLIAFTLLISVACLLCGFQQSGVPIMGSTGAPAAGGGSAAFVQANTVLVTSGQSAQCTLSATVSGHFIGGVFFTNDGGVSGQAFTDSATQTYTVPSSGQHGFIWWGWKANTASGVTSLTFSITSSAQRIQGICFEYSGVGAAKGAQDGFIDNTSASGTTYDSGAFTTAGTADLLLGAIFNSSSNTVTLAPNAPFSVRKELNDSGSGTRQSLVDSLSSNAGTYHNSGGFSSGSNTYQATGLGITTQ